MNKENYEIKKIYEYIFHSYNGVPLIGHVSVFFKLYFRTNKII